MKQKFLTALLATFCAVCLTMFSACDLLSNLTNGNDDQGSAQTGGDASGGSAEHTHTLVKTAAKEATCYSEGNIVYWTCSGCGKYFADSEAKTEIELEDTILSVSHMYDGSWTCTVCGNTLTESEGLKFVAQGNSYGVSIGTCTDSEIVIPYTHNGLPVTTIVSFQAGTSITSIYIPDSIEYIESEAFDACTSLKTINIPKKVSYIGEGAFAACSSLTNITVDTENEYYKSVDGNLYSYDGTVLVQYALGKPEASFTIPDGVTEINSKAFSLYYKKSDEYTVKSYLNEVIIPDSMTTIHEGAFLYAYTLTNIILSDSITTIELDAFCACHSLISITIPKNVSTIETEAFYLCYKLVEIYNLSSLNLTKGSVSNGYIGYYAKNIYTASDGQSNLIDQDGYVFYNNNDSYYLMGYNGTETDLILPETINNHTYSLYAYNTGYKNYALTFIQNSKITSIILPSCLTTLYNGTFSGCTSLESITLPDGTTSIESETFYQCTSLKTITIPDSLTSIGKYAFYGCGVIKELNISTTDLSVWYSSSKLMNLFELLANTLTNYFSDKLSYEQHSFYSLYFNGELLTDLVIPDGVTSICEGAFAFCSSITSVTIPSSVTSIDDGAFYCCDNLTSVTFEDASGWYVSETKGAASGTSVSVSNASKNAEYLTDTYGMYYWYKK